MSDFEQWLNLPIASINSNTSEQAAGRQAQLTKPAGSLGLLETIAVQLAGLQSNVKPTIDKVQITVFAADHGIVSEGISAFPQAVTAEMIRNFSRGGAAISVLANENNAKLTVVNVGTVSELEPLMHVQDARIAAGTNNFAQQAAMSSKHCQQAMMVGRKISQQAKEAGIDLFIGGEMGIGNTTSATAIASALLSSPAEQLAGPGTGLNDEQVAHKASIINAAIKRHKNEIPTPLDILHYLGGFEIAALVGCYLHCAKIGLPVLVDGFITSVAALVAERIQPTSKQWFLFSHQSAEPGHQAILSELEALPLLDINMRLGEASGAAVVLPLIKLSCSLHNNMATFAEAAVSGQS